MKRVCDQRDLRKTELNNEKSSDYDNVNNNSSHIKKKNQGFPGGAVVKNPPANAGDTGSSPGLGGSHMPQSN